MGVRYKSNIQDGFFYWSALENDLVSDYITNPIKKVPEFPMGLALQNSENPHNLQAQFRYWENIHVGKYCMGLFLGNSS